MNGYGRCAVAIGRTAAFATLAEALSAPSPGLVNRFDNGSHSDMNIYTFAASSALLTQFFIEAAGLGLSRRTDEHGKHSSELFNDMFMNLNRIGRAAEQEMWELVGVNTHKGTIYLLLLLCCAAGFLFEGNKTVDVQAVCRLAADIAAPQIERELSESRCLKYQELSTGLRAYIVFGFKGIRGEVLSEFRLCRKVGIPAINESLGNGSAFNDALVHCLIRLMSENEDTTLLNRSFEADNINLVQTWSRGILSAGSVFTDEGRKKINDFQKEMADRRLSPGGSADLVSGSLFLYLLDYINKGGGTLGELLAR
ncbi:MAG TPA: triphosphoribosyl-dephospho-CoA synthase [Ruminiclostridium sp.]|nr:triphosphoribosyl-dephospho-CoA synthase [Ruminiclostridium sp.]